MIDLIKAAKKAQEIVNERREKFQPTHVIKTNSGLKRVQVYTRSHTFPMIANTMFIDSDRQLYNTSIENAKPLSSSS